MTLNACKAREEEKEEEESGHCKVGCTFCGRLETCLKTEKTLHPHQHGPPHPTGPKIPPCKSLIPSKPATTNGGDTRGLACSTIVKLGVCVCVCAYTKLQFLHPAAFRHKHNTCPSATKLCMHLNLTFAAPHTIMLHANLFLLRSYM